MTPTLHFHPLSSFCHKVLIALYENGTAFQGRIVNLGDPAERAALKALWPVGKFPVLEDGARSRTIAESSIIIEYLDLHYPGPNRLLPADAEACLDTRFWDRFFDLYVELPLQRIVGEKIRADGGADPQAVETAKAGLATAYDILEPHMRGRDWAAGTGFTIADCAAAPALFYANAILPVGANRPHLAAYLDRLTGRPSYARVLAEAQPYMQFFPFKDGLPARFRDGASS
ncbi:MAG: glutathione S-transferase family protein [Alphaproteobacteria bacterium]